jgi:hypothetical protein
MSSSVVSAYLPSSEISPSSSLDSTPEIHLEHRYWNLSHQVRTSSRQYDKTFWTNLTAPVRKDRLPSILDPLIDHVHRSSKLFWPALQFVLEDLVWFPEFGWTAEESSEWFCVMLHGNSIFPTARVPVGNVLGSDIHQLRDWTWTGIPFLRDDILQPPRNIIRK